MPYPRPISDPNSALVSGQNGKAAARRPVPVIPAENRREREPASRIDTIASAARRTLAPIPDHARRGKAVVGGALVEVGAVFIRPGL